MHQYHGEVLAAPLVRVAVVEGILGTLAFYCPVKNRNDATLALITDSNGSKACKPHEELNRVSVSTRLIAKRW
jgi:hypothetical protein